MLAATGCEGKGVPMLSHRPHAVADAVFAEPRAAHSAAEGWLGGPARVRCSSGDGRRRPLSGAFSSAPQALRVQ